MAGWGEGLKPRIYYENPDLYWWNIRDQGMTDHELLIEQAEMDRTEYNLMLKENVLEEMEATNTLVKPVHNPVTGIYRPDQMNLKRLDYLVAYKQRKIREGRIDQRVLLAELRELAKLRRNIKSKNVMLG